MSCGRDQRGESAQKRDGLEHDLGLASVVWLSQPIADLADGGDRQTLMGKRRSATIAQQPLEARSIPGGH